MAVLTEPIVCTEKRISTHTHGIIITTTMVMMMWNRRRRRRKRKKEGEGGSWIRTRFITQHDPIEQAKASWSTNDSGSFVFISHLADVVCQLAHAPELYCFKLTCPLQSSITIIKQQQRSDQVLSHMMPQINEVTTSYPKSPALLVIDIQQCLVVSFPLLEFLLACGDSGFQAFALQRRTTTVIWAIILYKRYVRFVCYLHYIHVVNGGNGVQTVDQD